MINIPREKEQFASIPEGNNDNAVHHLKYLDSKNVTRLDAEDSIELGVMVSQRVWPATQDDNRPGTIILSAVDSWQLTLASSDLIHHPNNGPVLLINKDEIPETTLHEIHRLKPKGNKNGTQIMVMGEVDSAVLDKLGNYEVRQITEENPAKFAAKVDSHYAEVTGETPNNIIIVSSDEKAKPFSIVATYWIAHMPEPVLFVTDKEVPESTKEAIKQRSNPNLYILGPDSIISRDVAEELGKLGKVTRIEGENAEETSLSFTQFSDEESGFGWGIEKPGHGFSFISSDKPDTALVTAPFAHLGKHAPLLFLQNGEVSENMARYLAKVKPTFTDSPMSGPYNHGFIIGSLEDISYYNQGVIDSKLEIEQSKGGGHGSH